MFSCYQQRFSILAYLPLILFAFAILSLSRIGLMIWHQELLPEDSVLYILLMGLRYDAAAVCALFALPCLITTICSFFNFVPRLLLKILCLYLAFIMAFLTMNEVATPGFINEFGIRPNQIYVKYLIYPKEVIKTLLSGHKLELFISLFITITVFTAAYFFQRYIFNIIEKRFACLDKLQHKKILFPSRRRLLVELLLILSIVPMGIRSTFGHRPLNPAMAYFCEIPLVNTLPVNSSYSAVYALVHLNDTELNRDMIYDIVAEDKVIAEAKKLSAAFWEEEGGNGCPLVQRIIPANGVTEPRNIVIILEESMGGGFVASLGGQPLTPELERLKDLGWWFENMYAAGHRSIRGIEAVSAGFPPSPLESIVKLLPHGEPYAAIPEVLRSAGYQTSFIYGGESHFDNMRSYFLNNGCMQVIEQKDYDNPMFVASWGVSDEDLFNRAHEQFMNHHEKGETFFSLVFTSSFHDPFEIPEGKVSLDRDYGEENARLLAVKYADYALGRFMDQALASPYASNTVFLIIADHESRVRGTGLFPLSQFKIPALIIAPNLEPYQDKRLVSQIDMPPTLLSLAGFSGTVPYVGQNLLQIDAKQRALMQFNDNFGYLDENGLTVLTPRKDPDFFIVEGRELIKKEIPEKAAERTAALENLGPLLYQKGYLSRSCIRISQ